LVLRETPVVVKSDGKCRFSLYFTISRDSSVTVRA